MSSDFCWSLGAARALAHITDHTVAQHKFDIHGKIGYCLLLYYMVSIIQQIYLVRRCIRFFFFRPSLHFVSM